MSQVSLSDIQPEDFDTYTCHVNNSVRHMNKSISLTEAGMYKHGRHMRGCCMELSGVCPRYSINILNAQFECVSQHSFVHSHFCTTSFTVSRVSFVHNLLHCVKGILCTQPASLCQGYPLYTACFTVSRVSFVHSLLHCVKGILCTQPASLCQGYPLYTACFTVSRVSFVHSLLHCIKGILCTQPASLCQGYPLYTACFTVSRVSFVHSLLHCVKGILCTQLACFSVSMESAAC